MTASHTFRALTCGFGFGFVFLVKALSWISYLSWWLGQPAPKIRRKNKSLCSAPVAMGTF